jgi:hypothetical protein
MTIESLLEEIEVILEEGKTVPFTSNLLVDSAAIKTAIEDIRLNMPDELMQARKIASERKEILAGAQESADRLSKKHIFVQKKSFQKTKSLVVQKHRQQKSFNRQELRLLKLLNRQDRALQSLQSRQETGLTKCAQVQVNMLKAS